MKSTRRGFPDDLGLIHKEEERGDEEAKKKNVERIQGGGLCRGDCLYLWDAGTRKIVRCQF